jgi:O-antigen/teichoic acid export membrane protein
VTLWITVGLAAYALPVIIARDHLVGLIYGGEYRGIGDLLVLAALNIITVALAFGAGIGLTAARRTRTLFFVRMTATLVSATGFLLLARSLGVVGAGWANLLGSTVSTTLMWTAYRSARRHARAASTNASSRRAGRRIAIVSLLPAVGRATGRDLDKKRA